MLSWSSLWRTTRFSWNCVLANCIIIVVEFDFVFSKLRNNAVHSILRLSKRSIYARFAPCTSSQLIFRQFSEFWWIILGVSCAPKTPAAGLDSGSLENYTVLNKLSNNRPIVYLKSNIEIGDNNHKDTWGNTTLNSQPLEIKQMLSYWLTAMI